MRSDLSAIQLFLVVGQGRENVILNVAFVLTAQDSEEAACKLIH
jgi:hypothetical protein